MLFSARAATQPTGGAAELYELLQWRLIYLLAFCTFSSESNKATPRFYSYHFLLGLIGDVTVAPLYPAVQEAQRKIFR